MSGEPFERNGWTCRTYPSLGKYVASESRVKLLASRGEGRTRQVINVELFDYQVADFDPSAFYGRPAVKR